ncbi:MAG: DUF616 domain-containing protein [Streptococcaceae bacterium]|nr:DUF616 domain-containing protein [Streptococcaceae bacterium]
MAKKVIYTCITGQYDLPIEHQFVNPEYDYICYTDNNNNKIENSIWEFRQLKFSKLDSIRNARWHKLHAHELFPEYGESLWIDGNINVLSEEFFSKMNELNDSEFIASARHESRDNLFDELNECIIQRKDISKTMRMQKQKMKATGFNGIYAHGNFFETNVLLRKQHDKRCIRLMQDWWYWIENYSYRDQLSFTFVLWDNNYSASFLFDELLRYVKFVKIDAHGNLPNFYQKRIMGIKRRFHLYF